LPLDKYLLALRCLLAASTLDPAHPTLHEQTVRFKLAVGANSSIPEKAAEVIKAEFTIFPESMTPSKFNEDFLSKHSHSARHVYAALRVRQLLPSHDKSKSEAEILAPLDFPDIKLTEAIEGLELLSSWRSNTEPYLSKAHSLWPEATVFKSSTDL
jgi:N-alpha-acetyltransferase 15/16, NatA auxiliary subunit